MHVRARANAKRRADEGNGGMQCTGEESVSWDVEGKPVQVACASAVGSQGTRTQRPGRGKSVVFDGCARKKGTMSA